MPFAILRTAKLKTIGNIAASLSHNYRTRETLNADQNRSNLNEHSLESAQAVKDAIQERLPEKRRSDAVLCIEHLITASPEWTGWGTNQEREFFDTSKKWLEEKYGAQNVVATTIHRDETTPHLVAYVVPLDADTGRLNAKKWLGGRDKLSRMQTDFASEVKNLGLERGIEGSKATHTSIKEHYAKVNDAENAPKIQFEMPDFPKTDLFESKEKYANRVADVVVDSIFNQIALEWDRMAVLSSEVKLARKELLEARETLSSTIERAKPYFDAIDGIKHNGIEYIDEKLAEIRSRMDYQYQEYLKNIEHKKREEKEKEDANRFARNWHHTFEHMSSEQKESYHFMRDHKIRFNTQSDSMLQFELEQIKRRLIENSNYTLEDYHWRAEKQRKREASYKPSEHQELKQEKDNGINYDPFN